MLIGADGHIRLADFGTCKEIGCDVDSAADIEIRRLATKIGTTDYMAPEVLLGITYAKGADWWSFGICLYEVITGFLPFAGNSERGTIAEVVAQKQLDLNEVQIALTKNGVDLINRLLEKNRDSRLGCSCFGAKEVLEHPWFHDSPTTPNQVENRSCEPPWKPALSGGAADIEWMNKKWLNCHWSLKDTHINVGVQSNLDNHHPLISWNSNLEPVTSAKEVRAERPQDKLLLFLCCNEQRSL